MAIPNLSDFNVVRQLLTNQSQEAKKTRDEMARVAAYTKAAAGVALGITAMICVANLITAFSAPIIGCLALLSNAVIGLAFREIFIISGNVADTLNNNGMTGNILTRGSAALTPQRFVDSIFADTWIAGPILGASIVQTYELSLSS